MYTALGCSRTITNSRKVGTLVQNAHGNAREEDGDPAGGRAGSQTLRCKYHVPFHSTTITNEQKWEIARRWDARADEGWRTLRYFDQCSEEDWSEFGKFIGQGKTLEEAKDLHSNFRSWMSLEAELGR